MLLPHKLSMFLSVLGLLVGISLGDPPARNITRADPNVPGVYICNGLDFAQPCAKSTFNGSSGCMDMPFKMSGGIHNVGISFSPDLGVVCNLYRVKNCGGYSQQVVHPGTGNLGLLMMDSGDALDGWHGFVSYQCNNTCIEPDDPCWAAAPTRTQPLNLTSKIVPSQPEASTLHMSSILDALMNDLPIPTSGLLGSLQVIEVKPDGSTNTIHDTAANAVQDQAIPGVYMCNGVGWQQPCTYFTFIHSTTVCMAMPYRLNGKGKPNMSFGPDKGISCVLYQGDSCDGSSTRTRWPGIADLGEWADMHGDVDGGWPGYFSFKCQYATLEEARQLNGPLTTSSRSSKSVSKSLVAPTPPSSTPMPPNAPRSVDVEQTISVEGTYTLFANDNPTYFSQTWAPYEKTPPWGFLICTNAFRNQLCRFYYATYHSIECQSMPSVNVENGLLPDYKFVMSRNTTCKIFRGPTCNANWTTVRSPEILHLKQWSNQQLINWALIDGRLDRRFEGNLTLACENTP